MATTARKAQAGRLRQWIYRDGVVTVARVGSFLGSTLVCASVLSGPTGDDVTVAGDTGTVILVFLLITFLVTYLVGSFTTWSSLPTRRQNCRGEGSPADSS